MYSKDYNKIYILLASLSLLGAAITTRSFYLLFREKIALERELGAKEQVVRVEVKEVKE